MKKFIKKAALAIITVFAMCSLNSCLIDSNEVDFSLKGLSQEKVYFLYEPGCTYSAQARNYIYATYPGIEMQEINIFTEDDYRHAFRHDYEVYNIQTPVICFGDDYVAGWNDENKKKVDVYIQKYIH